MIRRISNYGSGGKCIPLTKDLRELFGIEDYIEITQENGRLIITPIKSPKKKKVSQKSRCI